VVYEEGWMPYRAPAPSPEDDTVRMLV
jgi:hypothetical protein